MQKNDFLLCKIRQRLILAQPEELVRQALVGKLLESGVDESLIDLEVPLSRFKKRAQGRADVIVYANDQRKNVALVIECKAKSVSLSSSVLDQVARYNKVFKCNYVCLANGYDFLVYKENNSHYEELQLEKVEELFDSNIKLEPVDIFNWERTSQGLLNDPNFLKEYEILTTGAPSYPIARHFLDIDSSESIKKLAIRIVDLLYDMSEENTLDTIGSSFANLEKDLGERFSRYTYFGGEESFSEYYRHLLLQFKSNKDYFTLSTALYSYDYLNLETEIHHKSKYRGTYIMFGFNYMENSNHTLEYKLDKHIKECDQGYEFWHDGSITVVKRQKNRDLINFVSTHKPELVRNGKILLGVLPRSGPLFMNNSMVSSLFSNFIDYIIIRELFRAKIREAKGSSHSQPF